MSLRDQVRSIEIAPRIFGASTAHDQDDEELAFGALKGRIHSALLERIDLKAMAALEQPQFRAELKRLIDELLSTEDIVINDQERRNLVRDIEHEMRGLGPLELLMADNTVSDILVNTSSKVYVERFGKLEATDVCFRNDAHLMTIIDKIVSQVGRRIDESSPMVDARLPDGSRVNVIIPPLAIDGPVMSIRRFAGKPLRMTDLIRHRSVVPPIAQFLEGLVRAKVNMIISGGTGSGKTTLLNVLSSYIGVRERVVTIEDAAELQLQQPHVVRLESRPPNIEGNGEVSQRALVRNALRMRPDRIILGEVRGAEAIDMLQAMNTGHEGSLATIHANTPNDALTRLENMVALGGMHMNTGVARHQISAAISVIIQVTRLADGQRKVVSVQEITGMEGDVIARQEIFAFRQTGVNSAGIVQGQFCATGVRPQLVERLRVHGIELPTNLFDPLQRHDAEA